MANGHLSTLKWQPDPQSWHTEPTEVWLLFAVMTSPNLQDPLVPLTALQWYTPVQKPSAPFTAQTWLLTRSWECKMKVEELQHRRSELESREPRTPLFHPCWACASSDSTGWETSVPGSDHFIGQPVPSVDILISKPKVSTLPWLTDHCTSLRKHLLPEHEW